MERESAHFFADDAASAGEESLEIRNKAEIKEIEARLTTLIRTVSGKPTIEVTTEVDPQTLAGMAAEGKDANKEWFRLTRHDPKTKKPIAELVHIPPQIFERSEAIAKGKAAHEGGHVAITRMGEFVPDEVLQELGFHSLMLAAEERPTDQVVRDRYPGAGDWVDEARADNVIEALQIQKNEKQLGYIPKFSQVCDLIVHAPHYKEMPSYYDEEALALYEKIKGDVEKVEHSLPKEGASEEEILAAAKERYKIVYSKIWKEVKDVVKEDLKKEEARQMILGNSQEEESKMLEALKEELRNELKSIIDRVLENEEGSSSVPMDEMSKELLKALQKIFKALSSEKKKELTSKAEKTLENLEDDLVHTLSGALVENPTETHAEHKERKEEEIKKETEAERIKKEMKEVERKEAAFRRDMSLYEKTYQTLREADEELYARLEEIFMPNVKRTVTLKSSGSRINLPALFRWEAGRSAGAPSLDNRIFESVHLPEKKDYVFTLLVDLSGSMNGTKIKETFKAVIILTEVLNRLGIKNEILGFQDEVINFKNFDSELNDAIRNKMSGMIDETTNRNPGGHNNAGYNDDGPCLTRASADLEAQTGKEKFLIVLSDGVPAGRWSTEYDLETAVAKILKETNQKLVAIGLGVDTEHVKDFYPTALPNIEVKKLPEVLGNLLEDMIRFPAKYNV